MARQVILVDDLDGSRDDVKTVELAFDGRTVELDLSASNRAGLAAAVERYFAVGRTVRRPSSGSTRRRATPQEAAERRAIRDWAAQTGLQLSTRGPIPEDVVARYRQNHGGEA